MARGRMITNEIARDKKVNELSCDTSRLAFTWLITFADVEGRTYGDPVLVKNMLFPRRDDITTEQMITYISEWAEAGLIIWYETRGDKWITFPNFRRHQPNLRVDREPASIIPEPNHDAGDMTADCRILAGVLPEHIPVKLREEKRIEVILTPLQNAFIEASGIPGYSTADAETYQALFNAGCTPEDITRAVETLQHKKYTIKGIGSIVTTAINIAKQRSSKKESEEVFTEVWK